MRTRTKTLLFLSSLFILGLFLISGAHLAAQAPDPTLPAPTIPATLPVPTIPATLPIPTIPAGQHIWLPQIYNTAATPAA